MDQRSRMNILIDLLVPKESKELVKGQFDRMNDGELARFLMYLDLQLAQPASMILNKAIELISVRPQEL